jgi:hypothetical protein
VAKLTRVAQKGRSIPTRRSKSSKKKRSHLNDPWGDKLRKVDSILDGLESPFVTRIIGDKGLLAVVPLWIFPSFPTFEGLKAAKLFNGLSREERLANWANISAELMQFKVPLRIQLWALLRACDSEARQAVTWYAEVIKAYQKCISSEMARVKELQNMLKSLVDDPGLFPVPKDSLGPLITHCLEVVEKVDRALRVIGEAHAELNPAIVFFFNSKAPARSVVKERLVKLIISGGKGKNAAATLATDLLNWADPLRPVKQGALRQLAHKATLFPRSL